MTPAKVQEELDATVGRTRTPRLEDRTRLPYTNAVLHEIQRFISVLPLGLPRALTRDTHLRNHFLHKVHRESENSALGQGSISVYLEIRLSEDSTPKLLISSQGRGENLPNTCKALG